jgi:hypothetical protein
MQSSGRNGFKSWDITPTHPEFLQLFHYTERRSFAAITNRTEDDLDYIGDTELDITEEAVLRPSTGEGGVDAFHGPGFYLTDLHPFKWERRKIANRLWDRAGNEMLHRTEYWIMFFVPRNAVRNPRKHHFVLDTSDGRWISWVVACGAHNEII